MMNGKKMIDKVKAIASEKVAEHELKKIARAEAIAAEEEGQRVDETKNIIGRVTREIDNSQSQISSVNGKSGTIKAANDEIIEIIQKLAGISRDNAAATEETNASTEELNAMMQELSQGAVELHEVADHVKGFVSRFVV